MKGKKQKMKVIPHCYRRTLSKTLSNSSVSQLVQIGSYKKRIKDLSRNNRHLATALQEARIEAAFHSNTLKDYAKDCNKILFARLKLNDMAKNLAQFVTDLDEVRSYLNVDLPTDNNPFVPKKGSPSDRLCKEPAINCIDEVSEESSMNVAENVCTIPDLTPTHNAGDKISDVLPSTFKKNTDFVNEENLEMPPILFAEDTDEKKKKSSSKKKTSKVSYDPDKGSLTPELNIPTCVKLKRNSSRRQSQFIFPGSRSTSRGKNTSLGKENSPEELITPVKPSPLLKHREQVATEIKQTIEISKSPINNQSIKDKESENHLQTVVGAPQPDLSNVSSVNTVKSLKTTVTPEVQSGESNDTVHICVDMELTEVIRPTHQIIVENDLPFPIKSLDNAVLVDCDITKESKENNAQGFYDENKDSSCNKETTTEKDSLDLLNTRLTTPKLPDDDNIQLPEINEDDEVQNVGRITFCEPNDDDDRNTVGRRTTKSSLNKRSRQVKPVKYAVFFSSDESDTDSSFEIFTKKTKTSMQKRKTVISNKTDKPCEKTEDTAGHSKASSEFENGMVKNDLKLTVDTLHLGKDLKQVEKKLSKKSSDMKISSKDNLPKKSNKKCSATSEDENIQLEKNENVKKPRLNHENVKKSGLSHENEKKSGLSNENVEKSGLSHENVKKSGLSHENEKKLGLSNENVKRSGLNHKNEKKSGLNHENGKKPGHSHENVKKSGLNHENVKRSGLSHENVKKSRLSHENVQKSGFSHENVQKSGLSHKDMIKLIFSPISSPGGILKKCESNLQSTKETPLNKSVRNNNLDDSITNEIQTPKSESKKVSFAPTDIVCNFKRMSVSKKISENKKVRRTSKSVLDFEELLQQEVPTKTSHVGADNSSESTNIQKLDDPIFSNFSGDTELYTFSIPKNTNFLSIPTTDDLLRKCTASSNASQKNINKNSRQSKKILPGSKSVNTTKKLSLKKSKDPKNTEPNLVPGERDFLICESPVSISKPVKRKSLFKEDLLNDSKENINLDQQILEKPKTQEKNKTEINMNSELSTQNNYLKPSSSTKNQSKVRRKTSTKKLSDKQKLLEPSSELKRKKQSVAMKSHENSPVLKDTINLPETQDGIVTKRRSKQISYKEPSLHKKLRRD